MKFTKEFNDILKHFFTINPHMYFKKGSVQDTLGSSQMFVRANTNVEIDQEFGVANLGRLIQAIKICDNPDIEIDGADIVISDKNKIIRLAQTLPEYLNYEGKPDRFKRPIGVEGKIDKDTFKSILEVQNVVQSTHISFIGEDEDFMIKVCSPTDFGSSSKDEAIFNIGRTDQSFIATIASSNFLMKEDNYDIVIYRKGAVYLKSAIYEYFVSCDAKNSVLS